MSVLSRDAILDAVKKGDIVIDDFEEKFLGAASYDLTLANEFRHFKPGQGVLDVNTDYKDITEKVVIEDGKSYVLSPHQCCLAITKEKITLSPKICGLLEGRSRFARLGLFVHITAGFMNPGISNQQVLEIYNASNNPIALTPGTRICQFVFMTLLGQAKYHGKFENQVL
jgi:dCTP deaminase